MHAGLGKLGYQREPQWEDLRMKQRLRNATGKSRTALVIFAVFTQAVALVARAGSAQADTLISICGYAIQAAGKYRLATDLGPCSGDGIDIRTGNVTLDLDGYTITGPANGNGAGIDVEVGGSRAKGINIKGPGRIQKFSYGIFLSNTDNAQVQDVLLEINSDYGIYVNGSVNVQLQDNVFTHNGSYGLLLLNSGGSQVYDNYISGNGNSGTSDAGGLDIAGGTGSQVSGNIVDSNQPFGIVLFNAGQQQVEGNKIYGNYSTGFRIESASTGNVVRDNAAEGNLIYDLEDDNSGCDTNNWQNNVFFTSNQTCIR